MEEANDIHRHLIGPPSSVSAPALQVVPSVACPVPRVAASPVPHAYGVWKDEDVVLCSRRQYNVRKGLYHVIPAGIHELAWDQHLLSSHPCADARRIVHLRLVSVDGAEEHALQRCWSCSSPDSDRMQRYKDCVLDCEEAWCSTEG